MNKTILVILLIALVLGAAVFAVTSIPSASAISRHGNGDYNVCDAPGACKPGVVDPICCPSS